MKSALIQEAMGKKEAHSRNDGLISPLSGHKHFESD